MLRWSIMWDGGELRLGGGGVMAVCGAGTRWGVWDKFGVLA